MIIVPQLQGFFKSKFNTILFTILITIGIALAFSSSAQTAPEEEKFSVHYFFLPTCPHCAEQKPIIEELQKEMPDVAFLWHDASTPEGSQLFYKLAAEAGLDTTKLRVPTLISKRYYLVGVHSKQEIREMIEKCQKECAEKKAKTNSSQKIEEGFAEFELPFIGRTNLKEFSLPALAIVLGLIDGFNPCAMWVLVYLIALLMEVQDRKKSWIIIGSFLFASGALYFLFMTAWLNIFLLLGYIKIVTIIVGLIALGAGILNLKDYLEKRKEALKCEVRNHKKTMGRIQKIVAQPISIATIIAIIALAFVINSVEFVCSSAIPAVFTQVLAASSLNGLEYYAYILLYDIFFMIDDIIIFSLAVFAINSKFGEKYSKYSKILGGIILIALGIILLFAPALLR